MQVSMLSLRGGGGGGEAGQRWGIWIFGIENVQMPDSGA
jgi:hypothetical protein